MKHLSKLSPAETLLVLRGKSASLKELLKVTFMDLLLKQVVRTFEIEKQASSSDPIRIYKYIEAGKNYNTYRSLSHENVFLTAFQKSNNIQILFQHMVKMGYQNAKSATKLQNMLRQTINLERCFSCNFIQSLYGGFSITTEGQELRKNVTAEISQLEKQLPLLILNDHQKALDILKEIKGNIFLVPNIEFDLLKEIDQELLAEMNKQDQKNTDVGCSGCTWYNFDNYSESFDSSCSGGDSGCGGSGCGGCGGD